MAGLKTTGKNTNVDGQVKDDDGKHNRENLLDVRYES